MQAKSIILRRSGRPWPTRRVTYSAERPQGHLRPLTTLTDVAFGVSHVRSAHPRRSRHVRFAAVASQLWHPSESTQGAISGHNTRRDRVTLSLGRDEC